MAYVTYFNVLSTYTDLALKQIIVETNFKIEPSSVTMDNILLYKVDKENNHELVKFYSLGLDKTSKKILIQFDNYPECDSKYYIIVKNLIDKLGRELKSSYDRYIEFQYNVKTKTDINYPSDQSILKNNNIEFKIATSCEDKEIKYRIEISHDVAFFKKEYILISDNDTFVSNEFDYSIINYKLDISNKVLMCSINFKEDGQYFIRVRAEKDENVFGSWSNAVSFGITTAESPMQDSSGFLDDFLHSDVLYEEELEPLTEISSSEHAITNQEFFIEFNKDIDFTEDETSQYTEDGLLYIGKAYLIRRDL